MIYGSVELQITDRGGEYRNEVDASVAKMLGIQRSATIAYRPSSNGVIERVHATNNGVFAKTVNQKDWCEHVPHVTFAYHISYHISTKHSPFYLMFMRKPIPGLDMLWETQTERFSNDSDDLTNKMSNRMTISTVAKNLGCFFSRAKTRYYALVKELRF